MNALLNVRRRQYNTNDIDFLALDAPSLLISKSGDGETDAILTTSRKSLLHITVHRVHVVMRAYELYFSTGN